MNTVYPSAGVYTKETDLSQRIASVASSIGAMVGAAPKGPVGERTLVTDTVELKAMFGNQDAGKYGFMLYCADAFLRATNRLYVTRVVNGALTAGAYLTADDPNAPQPLLSINNFDDGANNPVGVIDPMKNMAFNPGDADINNNLMLICAADPGVWNNKIFVRVRPSNPKGRPVGSDHNLRHFYLDIFYDYTGPNNTPVESFLVSRRDGELGTDGQSMFVEDVINKFSKYVRVKNNPHCPELEMWNTTSKFISGGTDGNAVTTDQIAATWDIYDDPENIDVNLLVNCGYANPVVHRAMAQVAYSRFDAFAILDMPDDMYETAHAINYRKNDLNLNTSYAAIYTPWVQIRDTVNNKKIFIPPSGLVAAAYARTDSERALWFSPAGVRRGIMDVIGIRIKYKQGARDALDTAQINPICFFPGRGYLIWGDSTMQSTASALQRVNVRRLFNYIKKSVSTAVTFGVFDPNDEFLRSLLRHTVEDFLDPIKQGRGLYDYSVICDDRNNKPDTIANGDLYLDAYCDPVIAAKRIHMTAHIQPTGTQFSES